MRAAGEVVVYREVLQGRIWTARPVRVIQDTPALTALYLAHGTRWQCFTPLVPGATALQCKSFQVPWQLSELEWQFGGTVLLCSENAAHATHVMWDLAGSFAGWYVNLQEPLRRISQGFETLDQELDLWVEPDGRWRWKDEAHLAEAEALGVFSAAQGAAIRAEGQRVVRKIEARAAPFDESWKGWRAPAGWTMPVLPEDWAAI
jgi:hypothetical protein